MNGESGFQFAEPKNLRTVQHLSFSQESGVRLHDRMRDHGLIDQTNGVIPVPPGKD
jgi:hypothetical protein